MNKPPIGLVPRFIREKQRLHEIIEAIDRYELAEQEIPNEWYKEYAELSAKLMKEGHIR